MAAEVPVSEPSDLGAAAAFEPVCAHLMFDARAPEGSDLPGGYRISATFARGFRAPTFYDLYGPTSDFYQPNAALKPERNESS